MKNIKSFSVLILFTFCLFANTQAQQRRISEQEMTAIKNRSSLKNKSHLLRRSFTSFMKNGSEMSFFSNETTKYAANGDSHTVIEGGSGKINTIRTEIIKIGQTIYSLRSNGKWTESTLKIKDSQDEKVRGEIQPKTISSEHFYKGKTTVNNQEFDLYESKSVIKFSKNSETLTTVIQKNWFDQDGILIKIEEKTENELSRANRTFEVTLDPNIKIEAPTK